MPHVLSCPTTDVLERFVLGQTADEEADGLERHLEECATCRAALLAIQVDDPIVLAAQAAGTADTSEPAHAHGLTHGEMVEQLIERLSSLVGPGSDKTHASRHVSTPAEAESTQEIYDFLGPPEGLGEIGRLGSYRVLKLLGAGGMGVVFQAEDTNLHRLVAIKAIRPALAATASARRRFVREARAIAGLEHENIVKILHVGEDRGVPFLAMPFLPGETLEDRLAREGRLPIATVLEIGRQIAAGLAAAHDRGLVHRDVKPSNIWLERSRHAPRDESGRTKDAPMPDEAPVTNEVESEARIPHAERARYFAEHEHYCVKLLDFGLVRAVGGEEQTTHSSVIVGTPAYMAPEQAEGAAVDPRTDLFSLGCVLYRMCTGRAPFAEATTLKTLLALAKGRARRPSEFNPEVPPALEELVMRLLSRRAADRLASAREVAAELQAIAAGRVHSRRRRVTLAAIAAAVLLVGFMGHWTEWSFWWSRLPLAEREDHGRKGEERGGPAPVFEPAVNYACGLYPNQAVAADFNRDGRIDVAVANMHSHTISVLLGAGDGTFGSPVVSAAGEWFASTITPGDLNSDGQLDLMVVNAGSHQVSSLLGNGDGTFQPPVQFGVGRNPGLAAIGDWDRDGKPDVAVSDGNGISILIGNGDGRFQPATSVAVGVPVYFFVTADVNRDAKLDLVAAVRSDLSVSKQSNSALAVLLGKGDGTFQSPAFSGSGVAAENLVVADFDEDGNLDVVLGQTSATNVLLGQGDGRFREGPRFTEEWIGVVSIADFDADGHVDIVALSSDDLRIYFGNGDGTFRAGSNHAVGAWPQLPAAGDFNGDGATDLAVPSFSSNELSILLNRGTAPYRSMFGPAIHLPVGRSPLGVATSDFNFDGRLDLAVTNAGDDTVSVLMGDRDDSFQPASTISTGSRPSAVAAGDLNRDGRPDLMVAARGEDAVEVLLGTGSGVEFETGGSFATEQGPTSVALGDFNRDGRLDAVTANYDSGSVSVLLGNGDGTFQPAVHTPAGSKPSFVIASDWNRDGRRDLAVANYAQVGAVRVMLGTGDGTFRGAVTLPAGSFPRSLVADDFDRDGRLDLAVGNWGLGDINVFLGRGDGTFGNPTNFQFGGQGFGLAASDFDGDGRIDLAATDWQGHAVGILRGDGGGRFRRGGPCTVGLRPVALVAGHFNRDARPDLVVINSESDTISILRNRPAAPYLSAVPLANGLVGVPHRFTLHSFDADHNEVVVPDISFRFSSSDPQAELPDPGWKVSDGTRPEFVVTFHTAGIQTVTIETSDGSFLASRAITRVLRIDEIHLTLDDFPTAVTAGTPFSMTVYAKDPAGRDVPSYASTIRFTATDAAAKLPSDSRFATPVGYRTITNEFILNTPGEQTITVTDTAHPSLTASVRIRVK